MTSDTRLQPVNAYIADIQCAGIESAKKERLILLLKDLFSGAEADALIRDFVAGAEKARAAEPCRPTSWDACAASSAIIWAVNCKP